MKKILSKTIISLILINDMLFGGMVVSDPTSYTYYAQQIKAMNDQIKSALDQLEVLNKANEYLNTANDLMSNAGERIYNPQKQIMGLVNNLSNIQRNFENMAQRASNIGVERFFKDYHNVKEPLKDDILKKWKDNFNALFDNKEDDKYQKLNDKVLEAIQDNDYEAYQKAVEDLNEYIKLKGIEQDALKKYALLAPMELYNDYFVNEEVVKERKDKMERIKQLANQINSETDMVKQQQTTNQFLLEMLNVQQAQYEMQMSFFYAISTNLINEKSNSKQDIKKVIEEKENYASSKDSVKSKTTTSTEKYIDNLINSPKGNSIDNLLNGRVK
ncbi:hypothetical protein N5U97_02245 [Aliarcobacter butzleri]|uniref:hypothetical protein n=2 Tax=Aliarcobacter butzleri TaxID=28197 RepID=UPI0021B41936|nr:hypothetical protein [Aliarcobacter butzleri]MCT7576495.1 hypothetical protein [Aliarcobacter butzleri]MCT7627458.1 hypothetical protein [Aliarcobacter butzleri]